MKINCKRDRLIGILLAAMLLLGADAYAQRMRVQGHVTNQQGKSIPNVNIIDPVTNERIEISDEDGRYSVLAERHGSLKYTRWAESRLSTWYSKMRSLNLTR